MLIGRTLNTTEDVAQWLKDMEEAELSYHYDDDPRDIVVLDDRPIEDRRLFTDEEADILSKKMSVCEVLAGGWGAFWEMVPLPCENIINDKIGH